jgi:hypothetical protein
MKENGGKPLASFEARASHICSFVTRMAFGLHLFGCNEWSVRNRISIVEVTLEAVHTNLS